MDRNFFEQGKTPDEFVAGYGDNRARFEQLREESVLDDNHSQMVRLLPRDLNILVIAEPWSGDVLYNLPPLLRLAETAGWQVRIFHRDQYPELILPYRKDGLYHSIPVVIFYDQDFNELTHWIERPEQATRTIDEESLKLRRRLREEHKEEWRKATFDELFNLGLPGQ